MNLFEEIWAWFRDLWDTGNRLARILIIALPFWFFAQFGISFSGIPLAVTLPALIVPVGAVLWLITKKIEPLIVAVAAYPESGRRFIRFLNTAIAAEMAIGAYLSIIPVANRRELLPLLALLMSILFFASIGIEGAFRMFLIWASIAVITVLTAIFTFSSKPVKRGVDGAVAVLESAARSVDEFPRKFYDSVARRSGAKTEEPKPPVPEVMEVTETAGFVTVPAGTKKITFRLRRGERSPWLVLPCQHRFTVDHRFYPIYYERWGDEEPMEVQKPSQNFNLKDGLIRLLTNFDGEEVAIHLTPKS